MPGSTRTVHIGVIEMLIGYDILAEAIRPRVLIATGKIYRPIVGLVAVDPANVVVKNRRLAI